VRSLSDAELVVRVRHGDGRAFDALVRRYACDALTVARAILRDTADAEDVCQDAWIRALERIDECRSPDRFRFWFLQIVRNRARNAVEYRRVRSAETIDRALGTVAEAESADPGRRLHLQRRLGQLEVALRELSPSLREVLLLHDLDGWKHRAIAERLGISEVLSRKRAMQARARVRRLLYEA